ncbi:MAG: accessory gene regulator ArgB-like protein [Romboutsia sp.]|uniref:accessory gene regulator ArgB-like protein n=1 Tax=Romboutsia sp. TaxID=1965302 RepID=UPI003F2F99A7
MEIEKISIDISNKLGKRLDKDEEEIAVLNYGLFMLIHTTLAILITLCVGILTNMIIEMISISIVASLLKRYSGGVHSSTPKRCIITGIIFTLILSIICKYIMVNLNKNTFISIISVGILIFYYILYKKCPVPSKNKPLKKESTRNKLRKNSFKLVNIYIAAILVLYFLNIYNEMYIFKLGVSMIFLGISLQVFALTKAGEIVITTLEKVYNIFKV